MFRGGIRTRTFNRRVQMKTKKKVLPCSEQNKAGVTAKKRNTRGGDNCLVFVLFVSELTDCRKRERETPSLIGSLYPVSQSISRRRNPTLLYFLLLFPTPPSC
uniref:Uncharacterized protein n=1 Tax=Octopus bimaculoides TaxID=37653 RepID=A0A0L8HRA6_OCTBM